MYIFSKNNNMMVMMKRSISPHFKVDNSVDAQNIKSKISSDLDTALLDLGAEQIKIKSERYQNLAKIYCNFECKA